jgi:hypothetical protein
MGDTHIIDLACSSYMDGLALELFGFDSDFGDASWDMCLFCLCALILTVVSLPINCVCSALFP